MRNVAGKLVMACSRQGCSRFPVLDLMNPSTLMNKLLVVKAAQVVFFVNDW